MERLTKYTHQTTSSSPSGTVAAQKSINGTRSNNLCRSGMHVWAAVPHGSSKRATEDARDDSKLPLGSNEPHRIQRFPRAEPVDGRYVDTSMSYRRDNQHLSSICRITHRSGDAQFVRKSVVGFPNRTENNHGAGQTFPIDYRLPTVPRPIYDFSRPRQTGSQNHSNWYPQSSHRQTSQASQPLPGIHHVPVRSYTSRVVIPRNLSIPKELTRESTSGSESIDERKSAKRRNDSSDTAPTPLPPDPKRGKAGNGDHFSKLEMLCRATLALGPMVTETPSGCSCPKSQCIALYCECFKSGRRCNPDVCSCSKCKNTLKESGQGGARSLAIQSILTRNPRAFTSSTGPGPQGKPNPCPEGQGCNCIRSKCLKLYCTCFQQGKTCDPDICTCVDCHNVNDDSTGLRELAIQQTLEKRPDAFKKKPREKEPGSGCACKNNQCIRKYCECFRTNLKCTKRCSCKNCKNENQDEDKI